MAWFPDSKTADFFIPQRQYRWLHNISMCLSVRWTRDVSAECKVAVNQLSFDSHYKHRFRICMIITGTIWFNNGRYNWLDRKQHGFNEGQTSCLVRYLRLRFISCERWSWESNQMIRILHFLIRSELILQHHSTCLPQISFYQCRWIVILRFCRYASWLRAQNKRTGDGLKNRACTYASKATSASISRRYCIYWRTVAKSVHGTWADAKRTVWGHESDSR